MTLSFTSQPLRQGKSLYVPVPSSTPLVLLPLLLDRPLPLGSERNQIPSVSVFIPPTWTIIIAPRVFAERFSNTNRYGRHDLYNYNLPFFSRTKILSWQAN